MDADDDARRAARLAERQEVPYRRNACTERTAEIIVGPQRDRPRRDRGVAGLAGERRDTEIGADGATLLLVHDAVADVTIAGSGPRRTPRVEQAHTPSLVGLTRRSRRSRS